MGEELTKRAREIISKILYITIATSDRNGQPWNSPLYSAFDENYNFYWVSWRENQHSKNIKENNKIFIVIYDSTVPEGTGEGIYVQAKAYELNDEKEIENALEFLDGRINKTGHHKAFQFQDNMPRRVYKAVPEKIWINTSAKINGKYIDKRIEVKLI